MENGEFVYVQQTLKEYLTVEILERLFFDVKEGYMIPPFYLPVTRERFNGSFRCWIFPLAPFALVFTIIQRAFRSVWSDLLDTSDLIGLKNRRQRP